jgi:small subunit ribosomal protein S2
MGIPSICIIDTDANPQRVDIPIPANDDAYRSVHVILSKIVDAVVRGRTKLAVQRGIAAKATGIPETTPSPVPSPETAPSTTEPVPATAESSQGSGSENATA